MRIQLPAVISLFAMAGFTVALAFAYEGQPSTPPVPVPAVPATPITSPLDGAEAPMPVTPYGQQYTPFSAPPATTFPAQPLPSPISAPSPRIPPGSTGRQQSAIIHVLQNLAVDLQATGSEEEAEQLLKIAGQLQTKQEAQAAAKQLEAKEAELAKMQSEVNALRAAAGKIDQVVVQVKAVESAFSNLAPGAAVDEIRKFLPQDGSESRSAHLFRIIDAKQAQALIEKLRRQPEWVNFLAEPTIVARSGHPASHFVGDEIAWPFANAKTPDEATVGIGTKVVVQPFLLENRIGRLSVMCQLSSLDPQRTPAVEGVGPLPSIKTSRFETTVEMELGQTLLVSGSMQKRVATETRNYFGRPRTSSYVHDVQTIFLVSMHPVDASEAAQRPIHEPVPASPDEAAPKRRI